MALACCLLAAELGAVGIAQASGGARTGASRRLRGRASLLPVRCGRDVVRPGFLRENDRLRPGSQAYARGRGEPDAALRHARRSRRPGRRLVVPVVDRGPYGRLKAARTSPPRPPRPCSHRDGADPHPAAGRGRIRRAWALPPNRRHRHRSPLARCCCLHRGRHGHRGHRRSQRGLTAWSRRRRADAGPVERPPGRNSQARRSGRPPAPPSFPLPSPRTRRSARVSEASPGRVRAAGERRCPRTSKGGALALLGRDARGPRQPLRERPRAAPVHLGHDQPVAPSVLAEQVQRTSSARSASSSAESPAGRRSLSAAAQRQTVLEEAGEPLLEDLQPLRPGACDGCP